MRRRKPDPAVQAQVEALRRRVFPPEPVDVDEAVRQALRREREREAEERRIAEDRRFTGGPCALCGSTFSQVAIYPNVNEVEPGWRTHPRGCECGTCYGWKHYGIRGDAWLLDVVATILLREGLDGLANPNRNLFPEEPGLAEKMDIKFWCDTPGAPTGQAWMFLAGIREAYAAECEVRERERSVKVADLARRESEWREENPPATFEQLLRAEQARKVMAEQNERDRRAS